jgi:hypothetical protein
LLLSPTVAPPIARCESDAQPQKTKLVVVVITEEDMLPVAGARIIVTGPNDIDFSAKTNSSGEATILQLPGVELTVQVIATGFETAGKRVTLSSAIEKMTVTLKKSTALPDIEPDATPDVTVDGPQTE